MFLKIFIKVFQVEKCLNTYQKYEYTSTYCTQNIKNTIIVILLKIWFICYLIIF